MKIKKNDMIVVISGKDKGKQGKVLRVLPKKNKIMVEGVFIMKKHMRPRRQGEKGQRIEIPGFIDASDAKLICPKCGQPTRVGYKLTSLQGPHRKIGGQKNKIAEAEVKSPAASAPVTGLTDKSKYRICKKCHQEI